MWQTNWPPCWATTSTGRSLVRRRLDVELVRRHLVESRTAAQQAIQEGRVKLGGNPSPKAATLVGENDPLDLVGSGPRFVSRAGDKLEAALDEFSIDVSGRTAIDVGASTGGFTDCLLARGVVSVLAVDVGYGQLDWKLRTDDRVTVMDRTNVRHIDPESLGAPFGVIVADVSFISLTKIMEKLAALGDDSSDWVVLVKPQFEAGPDDVESGGVVSDPEVRDRCIQGVVDSAAGFGLIRQDGRDSPVPGAKSGNVEHLLWLRKGE